VQTADGNIALTQAKWNATGTDPDGKPVTVSEAGQSVTEGFEFIPLRHRVLLCLQFDDK
jgi:hypothetical protein